MNSNYDDVDKLLSHMHMKDFSYRSFRHDGSTPPLRVVRSKEEPQPAAKSEPRLEAVPKRDATPAMPAVVQPESAAKAPVVTQAPIAHIARPPIAQAAVVHAPLAEAPAAPPAASSRVGDALERLMRGSIADNAPKVNLHLELPLRPGPQEASLPPLVADPPINDVFRRLNALALLPPKIVVREER